MKYIVGCENNVKHSGKSDVLASSKTKRHLMARFCPEPLGSRECCPVPHGWILGVTACKIEGSKWTGTRIGQTVRIR